MLAQLAICDHWIAWKSHDLHGSFCRHRCRRLGSVAFLCWSCRCWIVLHGSFCRHCRWGHLKLVCCSFGTQPLWLLAELRGVQILQSTGRCVEVELRGSCGRSGTCGSCCSCGSGCRCCEPLWDVFLIHGASQMCRNMIAADTANCGHG